MSFFLTSASTVDEEIGLVLINNGYLEFAIYRKGVPTKITGQQIFNSLIEYLKLKKADFKGIRGLWNKSSDKIKHSTRLYLKV